MEIALIAAMSKNHVIGKDNKLPWHLAEDWRNFHQVTKGKPFIMGRKSYESADMLYSDFTNIVLTRQAHYSLPEKFTAASDIESALQMLKGAALVFILGGEEIFAATLPMASKLYLTIIPEDVEGDTFFPAVNWLAWEKVKSRWVDKDDENDYGYYIDEYVRR